MRYAVLLILFACAAAPADTPKVSTGPWDVTALKAAEVKPEWGETVGKAREVYYPGEPFKGKPTRVFAYYAKPATATARSRRWCSSTAAAARRSASGPSTGPPAATVPWRWTSPATAPTGRLADGGPDQSDDAKFRDFDDDDRTDMWTYHAVAAVLRGHSLLRVAAGGRQGPDRRHRASVGAAT